MHTDVDAYLRQFDGMPKYGEDEPHVQRGGGSRRLPTSNRMDAHTGHQNTPTLPYV